MSIYLLSPTSKNDTIHLPMITFTVLNVDLDLSTYDVLMFTSKQAVLSAQILNPNWKDIPCLAIGAATANIIRSLGGQVLHQAEDFYGKTLAKDIITKFRNKNILYLRPTLVSFDSKYFLQIAGLKLDEKILYKTSCIKHKPKDKPLKNAIIIFTSPSTIRCFLKNFEWDDSYTAIVIGIATKSHLPNNVKLFVADKPLIDACIVKAKEILTANRL